MDFFSKQNDHHKLLWLDPNYQKKKILPFHSEKVYFASSIEKSNYYLKHNFFSIIIVDQNVPSAIEYLLFIKKKNPLMSRIYIGDINEHQDLIKIINQSAFLYYLKKPWGKDTLLQAINKAYNYYIKKIEDLTLLEKVKKQNQKLEELTLGRENIIARRTFAIEKSKSEIKKEAEKIKHLTRFITQIATIGNLEDLIKFLKKEFTSKDSVNQIILYFKSINNEYKLIKFKSNRIIEIVLRSKFKTNPTITINSPEISQYLADQFKRPFGKIICFPLFFKNQVQILDHLYLFVEHSISDDYISSFIEFAKARIHPFNIVLDRLLLEEKLSLITSQWENTFDSISDPIVIIDIDYNVIRANKSFTHNFLKNKCYQNIHSNNEPCIGCPVNNALRIGQTQYGQIFVGKKIFQIHSYPIKTHVNLPPNNVINYYTDITNNKELYCNLVQGEKMAAIGMLAENISHELNNPLTGIKSFAQFFLQEPKLDKSLKENLQEIENASHRCQEIIKNFSNFCQEGKGELVLTPLKEIIYNTLPFLKIVLRRHIINISLTNENCLIKVEPHLMQQVIYNLINNSCQVMKNKGYIEIKDKIIKNKNNKNKTYLLIYIKDNGPGIAPDIINNIFEPFFTTKEEGKGTGLGLSISRLIIEKFSGKISVKSKLKEGTEFCIILPIYN